MSFSAQCYALGFNQLVADVKAQGDPIDAIFKKYSANDKDLNGCLHFKIAFDHNNNITKAEIFDSDFHGIDFPEEVQRYFLSEFESSQKYNLEGTSNEIESMICFYNEEQEKWRTELKKI